MNTHTNIQTTPQNASQKPKILVARAIFPEALAKLKESFEVLANQEDQILSPEELQNALSGVAVY